MLVSVHLYRVYTVKPDYNEFTTVKTIQDLEGEKDSFCLRIRRPGIGVNTNVL